MFCLMGRYQYFIMSLVKEQLSENRSMWTNITKKLLYLGLWRVTLIVTNIHKSKKNDFKTNERIQQTNTLDITQTEDSNNSFPDSCQHKITLTLTSTVNCTAGCFEFKTSSNEIGFIISTFKKSIKKSFPVFHNSYFVAILNQHSISWYNFIPTEHITKAVPHCCAFDL